MRQLPRPTPGFVALAVLLVFTTPTSGQVGSPVRLGIHLEPGQSYRMATTTETDISQTVMGQEQTSHLFNEMVVLSEVLSVDERGGARVRATYESVRVIQDGPMGRTEYDSDRPEGDTPQALRPYAFMIGESFTMDFGPEGSVDGVQGMGDFISRLIADLDLPPGPMADQIAASLEDQFSDESMAEMMRQGMTVLPTEPVAVGESWTRSTKVERLLPVTAEMTWTLRDRRNGIAYLDVRAVTRLDGSREMGPYVMTYDVSGEMTGTTEIDEATGLTLRSRMEDTSSGTMTMSGGPMGDTTMPMTSKTVTSSEIRPQR